jgi:hypothetical protein
VDADKFYENVVRKSPAFTTETQPAVAFAFAKAKADSGHGELAAGCSCRGVRKAIQQNEKLSSVRFAFL